jgi:hypothetical protein
MPKKAKAADDRRRAGSPALPDAPEIHQIPTSHGPLGDVNGLVEVYTKDMSRIMLGVSDITQQAAELHGRVSEFDTALADMLGKLEDLESRPARSGAAVVKTSLLRVVARPGSARAALPPRA